MRPGTVGVVSALIMWGLIVSVTGALLAFAAVVDRRARRRGQSPRLGGDVGHDVREHRRDTRAVGHHAGLIRWTPRHRHPR